MDNEHENRGVQMRTRSLQIALAVSALGPAALAVGFIAQAGWATAAWPFETGPLSSLFLGSILAAIAVATLWVSATADWGALGASALFPLLMLIGLATFVGPQGFAADDPGLLLFAAACAVGALYSLALLLAGARYELRDQRPVPRLVRASFAVFALVLIAAGVALVLGAQNVIPWSAGPESLAMFGLIFLGASSSYVYGVVRSVWGYVYAPLLGFLAYDLVLLAPLIASFPDVATEQRTSLIIYVAVLAYSGALGIYYLLVRRETRLLARARPPQET